jgi:crotonobetainyl-CoA:carnitine CoA-transferase CaiB-like acyl-CoA transferase
MSAVRSPSAPLLKGVVVVNAANGFVAAIASKLLSDLGATVRRGPFEAREAAQRIYPAYAALTSHEKPFAAEETLADVTSGADICIVGGEDLPGLAPDPRHASQAAANAKLVVLNIEGYPEGVPAAGRPAIDLLVQARSGLTYEHYSARPTPMTFLPSLYGAALQGVLGSLAALYARGARGRGQIVSTSLLEGALSWVTTWNTATEPDAGFLFNTPMDPRPLILKCADGAYIHIVLGSANAKYALYQELGIDDPSVKPGDSGAPNRNDPPEKFYGDVDLIAPYVAKRKRDELAVALNKAGIVAAAVQAPGEAWDDAQVRHDRLVVGAPGGGEMIGNAIHCITTSEFVDPDQDVTADMPLAGVRVLDFGAFTAGPLASMLLRKLGADVIKIEPLAGDPARNLPRAFMAANKGKRSLAIDMKAPEGRELVEQLLAKADAVGSNFRTGVAAKLGIDGAGLLKRYPRMVVYEGPAFGQTGPRATEVAFDLVLQALCGFEVRAGGEGNIPIWNRTFLADYGGGTLGAIGMVAALCHRQRTGRGAVVETSLLSTAMFLQSETIRAPDGAFSGNTMLNSEQTGFHPAECLYQARDGWLAISVREPAAIAGVKDVLHVNVPCEFATWGARQQEVIAKAVAARDLQELVAALNAAGVPAEFCAPAMETPTFEDPDLRRLGITEAAAHPLYGDVAQFGVFHRFSKSRHAAPARAPLKGEHTRDVLAEVGVTGEACDSLVAKGVVLGGERAQTSS